MHRLDSTTRRALLLHAAAALLVGAAGAGSTACAKGDEPAPSRGSLSVGSGGAGAGTGGSLASYAGGSGGSGPCFTCSPDLHQVLDCEGNVLETCAAGQACGLGGKCVEPCQAAADNKSSYGCDYYTYQSATSSDASTSCFVAFVANTWDTPVEITVERDGTVFGSDILRIPVGSGANIEYQPLPNGELPPGQIAVAFLAHYLADGEAPGCSETQGNCKCPAGITPAINETGGINGEGSGLTGTGRAPAFHISTTAPVVAYSMYPFGGGASAITSASLMLPTSAWDDNYIGVTPWEEQWEGWDSAGMGVLAVIAHEDDTVVTISPTARILGGFGVEGTDKGVPRSYDLKKGEVVQFSVASEPGVENQLTGSPIQANKSIGAFGWHPCFFVPSQFSVAQSSGWCDAGHQQLAPVRTLGSTYVAARHRSRIDGQDESPSWRIVGAVDGTKLEYDPAPPPGAPTELKSGERARFSASQPFVVKSQDDAHPFYMAAHMYGCANPEIGDWLGPMGRAGDPESVPVVPPLAFLNRYVFFTDPTYPETNLVLVRTRKDGAFHDVTLDCAGVISGWEPVGSSGEYEVARIDLVRHDFEPQNGCDNGRREISSDAPFGVTIWGWGTKESGPLHVNFPDGQCPGGGEGLCWGVFTQAVSYGYPAGMSLRPITSVVVPPEPK